MDLITAVAEAGRIAKETGENCYILDAPVYVDEHDEGQYVVGIRDACEIMFKPIVGHPEMRKLVGVVGPGDKDPFFNDVDLTLEYHKLTQ